jgi:P4 family phage/plasmid primase-like protien
MERPSPRIHNEKLKDGIHIIIPDIVTSPSVQIKAREMSIPHMKTIFDKIGTINTAEDVFDEAVIYRNPWIMYGFTKQDTLPYKITMKIKDGVIQKDLSEAEVKPREFLRKMSIRNKMKNCKMRDDKLLREELEEIDRNIDMKQSKLGTKISSIFKNTSSHYSIESLNEIVDILSEKRADDYNTWIHVGWCLKNINVELVDAWHLFSRKSDKYDQDYCQERWDEIQPGNIGIGTLIMWAKEDNLEKYNEIIKRDLNNVIMKGLKEKKVSDVSIVDVIYHMFHDKYKCANIKNSKWYKFENHRWAISDMGVDLNMKFHTDVQKAYEDYIKILNVQKMENSDDSDEMSKYDKKIEKVLNIISSLRNTNSKNRYMTECKNFFYEEDIASKMDSNSSILCFNNGVFDFNTLEFRDGSPNDYCTLCTNIDYVPYEEIDINMRDEILEFFSKVLVNKNLMEYILDFFAISLNGTYRDDKFHIWTGDGANGKSATIDFFERIIGDYSCKFNVSLLTSKRCESNEANPELEKAIGKRFAVLQEPQDNEKLNVGLMKEYSGNDKISVRGLYSSPILFRPQFKMVLTCNSLPFVSSDDGGTWRRIRVVEFSSRFCENPNPENPKEFKIDRNISEKFDLWRETFMSILIERYKRKNMNNIAIKEPYEITEFTNNYKKSNDYISDFFDEKVSPKEGGNATLNDMYTMYIRWHNNIHAHEKLKPKKKDALKFHIEKKGYKPESVDGNPKIIQYSGIVLDVE